MRIPLIVTTLLLAASVTFPAALADTGPDEPFLTDPAGDVVYEVRASALTQAVPTSGTAQGDSMDLVALYVDEGITDVTFTIEVVDLSGDDAGGNYEIMFAWDDSVFTARISFFNPVLGSANSWASLYVAAEGYYAHVTALDHSIDRSASTLSVDVPKVMLTSQDGKIPLAGDVLRDVHVAASNFQMGGNVNSEYTGTRMYDRMPDEGGADLELASGGHATGHLTLDAPDPVRVSNGGSMTIVYEAYLRNHADFDDEVDLETSGEPEGWTVRVLSPVRVSAGDETRILVIATIPFRHVHGGLDEFQVTATSRADPAAEAQMNLGVLHTPIPMPAGHHPDLFLHAQNFNEPPMDVIFPWSGIFMNTDSDHSEDEETATANTYRNGAPGWYIPMGPDLAIGLDFDITRTGVLEGSVIGRTMGEGSLTAELVYGPGGDGDIVLATAGPEPVNLALDQATPFSMDVTPTADADYVPYERGYNMRLILLLDRPGTPFSFGHAEPALVVQDFHLNLPLNEYHDRLRGDGEAESGLEIIAETPVEREARPGHMITYAFTLTNTGILADEFIVEVAGSAAEQARIVPDLVTLDAFENVKVTLGVRVPVDANDGQPFEVLVLARSTSDPSITAIGRTITTASHTADSQDESSALQQAQDAANQRKRIPEPGAALIVIAVAALAGLLGVRRRG